MPTNNTHPGHAGISDPRKSWAIRPLPSLRRSQQTVSKFITQPPPPPIITTVTDGLQNLTLHPHPQRNEWVTGCLICGKSYDQVMEETVADYLNQTAQPGETVRQIKRNAFIDGIQSGVFILSPRECRRLSPVTAWSTPLITMDKMRAHGDILCPYLKIKLIEPLLNNSLDKYSPPPVLKLYIYIFIC